MSEAVRRFGKVIGLTGLTVSLGEVKIEVSKIKL